MNVLILICITCIVSAAAITDARTGLIPDRISIGGFLTICIISALHHTLIPSLLGAGVAGGSLGFLHLVTRGRGLGLGDVKLALAIGAALGPVLGLIALGLAFIFGACFAIALLLMRRISRGHEMYFAPFLAAGTVVTTLVHLGDVL